MAKKTKSKRGGVRKNSGREKLKDKKEPVTFYYRPSYMKLWGGEEKFKEAVYDKFPG